MKTNMRVIFHEKKWAIQLKLMAIFICSTVPSLYLTGQLDYGIKNPGDKYEQKCSECMELINNLPVEEQFGAHVNDDNTIYFIATSIKWFETMIKNKYDGIAIDIVSKDRYDCDQKYISKRSLTRGDLQKPIYRDELFDNLVPNDYNQVIVEIGPLPSKYRGKDIEFNIMFIKNKYVCHYTNFYDIKAYRWALLDMGFYMDTLVYYNDWDTTYSEREQYLLRHKKMKFVIPFEKDKSEYNASDIKPLYESLKLSDFDIKKIKIRAYSSVEGNLARNIQLQEARANSIVEALQSYQHPSIETDIKASENWVEFYQDISLTAHEGLLKMNKSEIKEKLEDKKLQEKLEPYLKKHRKAIVVLELQKKDKYSGMEPKVLIELFNKSVADENISEAIKIQNSIFEKIKHENTPVNLIDKMELPKKKEYSILLNKNKMFPYLIHERNTLETYQELLDLHDLLPEDEKIRYNICALKFRIWLLGEITVNPETFQSEIVHLKDLGIPDELVTRMLINYEIIMSEYYLMQDDYKNKDKSLQKIQSYYESVPLKEDDYLNLSQYLTSYARYDWAIDLLEDKVDDVDVSEDLLFYYLNLTLIDKSMTKRTSYRNILLNAYNINNVRFCNIFDPYGKGGVTFQLLEDKYLRKTYCENCKE